MNVRCKDKFLNGKQHRRKKPKKKKKKFARQIGLWKSDIQRRVAL